MKREPPDWDSVLLPTKNVTQIFHAYMLYSVTCVASSKMFINNVVDVEKCFEVDICIVLAVNP